MHHWDGIKNYFCGVFVVFFVSVSVSVLLTSTVDVVVTVALTVDIMT